MIIITSLSVPRKHVASDYPQYSINKQNKAYPKSKHKDDNQQWQARALAETGMRYDNDCDFEGWNTAALTPH